MAKHIDVDKHQQAFRLYAKCRNKSRVSKDLGIPVATIHVWAKQEGWDIKLNDLKLKLESQLEVIRRARDNVIVQDQVDQLNFLEHLETVIADILLEGQIRPTRWSDVIQTMTFIQKEKRLITGQTTEIPRGEIEVTAKNEEDVDKDIATYLRLTGRGNGKNDLVKEGPGEGDFPNTPSPPNSSSVVEDKEKPRLVTPSITNSEEMSE